ncbi:peptide-binding protein [Anaerobacillus isosaccharinicus]|uniref:Peptide-binding protein n=1 Tax=Anaerobacillus isosaccharinicus TaxID=1532552 RepID=A0A1S2MFG8_9BACI|nr:peptide-binding protein [Anaerobacillus isosaccharinicus]MBA5584184.1 peptide-binding protein [Anaerobacillus isosaccharinicus]QOY37410.1 peptide-binding protein [Anaerobacillus isosaccharinicus]
MNSKKSLLTLLSMILMLSLFLVACGGNNTPTETETPAPGEQTDGESTEDATSGEPKQGGTIVLGSSGEPVLFNSLYHQDSASADVTDLVFAGLMQANENLEMQPLIAADFPEISEDGLEFTYTLREGVLFHDGTELTAEDVEFTYSIFKHEDYAGPRAGSFANMESVEATGKYEVKFTLSQADASFPTLASYGILPKHILGDIPVADLGEYQEFNIKNPIGAGPFKFVSWTQGQNLALEAFEDYFEGRPNLDKVTFRFASDSNALVLLMQTGDIDWMIAPPSEIPTIETFNHAKISNTLALRYDYIGWNLQNPLFQDVKVRQALTHAIDRQEIVDTIMEGNATVAHAPVSPLSWAYNDNVPKFDYDLDKASQLLAEAGWEPGADGILTKDGQRFSFTILSNDGNVVRRDIGIIVQQYLGQIGIEVKAEQMEWGAFLDKINPPNYDFDAVVLAWGLALDPDPRAIWHSSEIENGLNNISYSNPRVDEIADSNKQIMDQAERAAALAEVWEILAEEQPYTYMYYPQQFISLSNRVQGFTHHPRVNMYKVNEWWVDNN